MDYRFYMAQITGEDGEKFTTGNFKDLEAYYPGLRYKQFKGLNSYGNPKVYSETFAEDDEALVELGADGQREQTELTLTLYFIDLDKSDAAGYSSADKAYHDFMSFIEGHKIAYYDTARKRKAVMYLSSATTPTTDTLYGVAYKQVDFKFKNLFGRTFDESNDIFTTLGSTNTEK